MGYSTILAQSKLLADKVVDCLFGILIVLWIMRYAITHRGNFPPIE